MPLNNSNHRVDNMYMDFLSLSVQCSSRESFEQIILIDRLGKAVADLNPHIPADAREQAIQKLFAFTLMKFKFSNLATVKTPCMF